MKYNLLVLFSVFIAQVSLSQNTDLNPNRTKKGSLYFYWGWNQDWFSKSDLHFSGADYDFTLKDVVAADRQSDFSIDAYLNPTVMTIPQYNFRIGYYFKDNWDISFGIDHMKYVMKNYQTVKISGEINTGRSNYDGSYDNDDILLNEDFLKFEHTDGLNYLNIELRHTDNILDKNRVQINLIEGLGSGILFPKTNTTLWGTDRYDEFHLAGYGIGAILGVNFTFFNGFFIQSEVKGGFIDLPDVRTTSSPADKASQNFFFSQVNVVFGGIIQTKREPKSLKSALY